jgi:hypothetical protein
MKNKKPAITRGNTEGEKLVVNYMGRGISFVGGSVADPDPFDTDPDPAFHF